jgi:hypothetical protein
LWETQPRGEGEVDPGALQVDGMPRLLLDFHLQHPNDNDMAAWDAGRRNQGSCHPLEGHMAVLWARLGGMEKKLG